MKETTAPTVMASPEYRRFIEDLKTRVTTARISAARAVCSEMILLYWDIGRGIVEKQRLHDWGDSVVEMVAADLRRAFPDSQSFSPDNVWRMRQFHLAYTDVSFLGQAVPENTSAILGQAVPETGRGSSAITSNTIELLTAVPWGQHLQILKKVSGPAARLYYLRATARFGWSRNVLINQIKAGAYERAVAEKKTHNFPLALPAYLAEQADEMMKSGYNLEFLGIRRAVLERELEDRLVSRVQAFILEQRQGTRGRGPPLHRHHPLCGKGRLRSRIRPAHQEKPHRCRRLPTSIQTTSRFERQTPNCQTTG